MRLVMLPPLLSNAVLSSSLCIFCSPATSLVAMIWTGKRPCTLASLALPLAVSVCSRYYMQNQQKSTRSPPSSRVSKVMAFHSHCDSCYRGATCRASSGDDACPVQPCPGGCGVSLHSCKLDEHSLYTCLAALVPCTNAGYGCETILLRAKLGSHLAHCPASVTHCHFSYDRAIGGAPTPTLDRALDTGEGERQYCIDEKVLAADLALAEQDDRFYRRRSDEDRAKPLQFSLDAHPGSTLTDPASKSTARKHNIPSRMRVCIAASVDQYSYTNHRYSPVRYYCFPCNEVLRRDEFSTHWHDCHFGVHTSLSHIVERCPLRNYGCRHGVPRLTPTPNGASLEYLPEADCVSVKFPDHVTRDCETQPLHGSYAQHIKKQQELAIYGYGDETESYDVLSQLPAEILMTICGCLDSLGLWNLSLVNHYLRSVCFNLVRKRGIVYQCWRKNEATGKWEQGEKHWSFSRVYRGTGSWTYSDAPALCNHVSSCPLLVALTNPYNPDMQWELPCFTQLQSQLSQSNPSVRVFRKIFNEQKN